MAVRIAAGVVGLLLTACQLPGSGSSCRAQIAWVDFVQVGSIQYVATPASPMTLKESELGPVIAHVKFKVSGNVCDPNYRPKDGDAAFLGPGTPIYRVNGHPSDQLLAAQHDGHIVGYEATNNHRGVRDAGTPVIVYRDDGRTVANLLSQITTNNQASPVGRADEPG